MKKIEKTRFFFYIGDNGQIVGGCTSYEIAKNSGMSVKEVTKQQYENYLRDNSFIGRVRRSFINSDPPKFYKEDMGGLSLVGERYIIQNKSYRLVKEDGVWDIEIFIDYRLYVPVKYLFFFTKWIEITHNEEELGDLFEELYKEVLGEYKC